MNSQIVVVGSLNADFVVRMERFPAPSETLVGHSFQIFPGGKGANQACAVARLGGRVAMVGQVGNDAHGDFLIRELAETGANVKHISRDPVAPSGVAIIMVNGDGQNQIVVVPGSNGTFAEDQLESSRELILSAGVVLLQLEIPLPTVIAAARMARQAGARVILDPAPAQELPPDLLACVDYLTPNETELAALTGTTPQSLNHGNAAEKAHQLRARGAHTVIVKMGAEGALLVGQDKEYYWPAIPVQPVDTTAAGDAFNGAFAYALTCGLADREAGNFATAAAACSVTRGGAQPAMPTRAEVERLMRENS